MWKPQHCRAAARLGLRYPSDLTDAEWGLISPMIRPSKRWGRRRGVDVRGSFESDFLRAVDGLPMEISAEGFSAKEHGALLPHAMGLDGTLEHIHYALYVATREQAGREASPTAAIIDSQSARPRQKGGFARSARV